MNISQLGIVASAAASPLAQARGSEIDRVRVETVAQQRAVESALEAESAAGIGTTNEEQAATDRDADGRRPWEVPHSELPDEEASNEPHHAKDPTGRAGSQFDLSG